MRRQYQVSPPGFPLPFPRNSPYLDIFLAPPRMPTRIIAPPLCLSLRRPPPATVMFFQMEFADSGSSPRLAWFRACSRITLPPLRRALRPALFPSLTGSCRIFLISASYSISAIARHPFRFKMPRPWPTVEAHNRCANRHRAISDGTLVQPLRDVDLVAHNPARQHILEPLRVVQHLADELLVPVPHALVHGRLGVSDPRRPYLGPIRFRQVHQPGSRTLGIVEVRQQRGAAQAGQLRQASYDHG